MACEFLRNCRVLIGLVTLVLASFGAAALPTSTNTTPGNAVNKPVCPLPPPFAANVFWHQVPQLLQETGGYVTHQRAEKMFGVKLNKKVLGEAASYGLADGSGWYFKIFLLETTAELKGNPSGVSSTFTVTWPPNAFDDGLGAPETRTCVRGGDAVAALLNTGWILQAKVSGAIVRSSLKDRFTCGNGNQLDLYHYDQAGSILNDNLTCVDRFTVIGTPHPDLLPEIRNYWESVMSSTTGLKTLLDNHGQAAGATAESELEAAIDASPALQTVFNTALQNLTSADQPIAILAAPPPGSNEPTSGVRWNAVLSAAKQADGVSQDQPLSQSQLAQLVQQSGYAQQFYDVTTNGDGTVTVAESPSYFLTRTVRSTPRTSITL